MKKVLKIMLIIFTFLGIFIIIDTFQAKVFANRPFIKITENYSNDIKRDKGLFVYTYLFNNQENVTVFKWEKYAPPEIINNKREDNEMEKIENIIITINDKKYNATFYDNETVKQFVNHLPEEFKMQELNGNEKYVYMDYTLPTNSTNPKLIEAGDIMLYGNDCLVIFYQSFDTNYRYTKIGHIDNLNDLGTSDITVKFMK